MARERPPEEHDVVDGTGERDVEQAERLRHVFLALAVAVVVDAWRAGVERENQPVRHHGIRRDALTSAVPVANV